MIAAAIVERLSSFGWLQVTVGPVYITAIDQQRVRLRLWCRQCWERNEQPFTNMPRRCTVHHRSSFWADVPINFEKE